MPLGCVHFDEGRASSLLWPPPPAAAKLLQSCPTLCDPIDSDMQMQPTRLPRPWDSPGKNTGVD